MIIIDECGAALTTEMAIPIVAYQDHVKSVALLGDPWQSAPTFVSGNRNSAAHEMEKTVFYRYKKGQGNSVVRPDLQPHLFFFSVQHRSHPDIMEWSSEMFYNGRIEHGPSTTMPTDISRTSTSSSRVRMNTSSVILSQLSMRCRLKRRKAASQLSRPSMQSSLSLGVKDNATAWESMSTPLLLERLGPTFRCAT